jgi:hypothetical protein
MNDTAAMPILLALETCPKSVWDLQPEYDHDDQRYCVESIAAQFKNHGVGARAELFTMVAGWALTGKWPRFQKQPLFFLNVILSWAADQPYNLFHGKVPTAPPPWDSRFAASFLKETALSWYNLEFDRWVFERAKEAFALQKAIMGEPDDAYD